MRQSKSDPSYNQLEYLPYVMLIAISLSHLEAILIPKLQTLSFFSTLNAANFPPSLDTGGSSQSPELETIPPTTKGVPQSPPIPSMVLPKASQPELNSEAPTTEDVPRRPSIPSFPKAPPESKEHRSLGPMMKWDWLDDFVNGPEYSNGR